MAMATELVQLVGKLSSLLVHSILLLISVQQTSGSISITVSGCVCPGSTLMYECTVMGSRGGTVWTGSAFNCPSHNNEIFLLHSRFTSYGSYGSCNNGSIVAGILSVEDNHYISQLNVTITSDILGKTIGCGHDDGGYTYFQPLFLPVTARLPPPSQLYTSNMDFLLRRITFSWSPVGPDCPAIHYNILASNCGSCPTTTNHTNVTCTDVPADNSACIFAIQTVVYGNITGNISDQIRVNTGILNTNNMVYIISIGSLASALTVSIVISVVLTVIVIIITRSNIKIKAAQKRSSRENNSMCMESMYTNVTTQSPSAGAIDAQDNVAYGRTKYQQ